jgi:hypothetical protein
MPAMDLVREIERLAIAPDIFQARINRLLPHIRREVEHLATYADLVPTLEKARDALGGAGCEAMAAVLDDLLNNLYVLDDETREPSAG